MRLFEEEIVLQDVSYNGAPGLSHYPAPERSAASRRNAAYADPWWVLGVTAEYMVGPEDMRDKKGHCPMMMTVEVKLGEPGDDKVEEQESDEEGVNLPVPPKWPEEENNYKWRQWVQQVHIVKRQGNRMQGAMRFEV